VVAADGSVLGVLHGEENRIITPLDEVPLHVRHAVIAAEDRHFYGHDGYDLGAIARALGVNLRSGEVLQGGSTITQQLAKQNFVGEDQTVQRKLKEVFNAVALERAFRKDELLQRYLNQVYFGSGAYGIAAAAEEFFRVTPRDLTVDQAALLAGLIRAPGTLDPRANPGVAASRRDQVMTQMVAAGYLEPDEAEQLRDQPVEVLPPMDRSPFEPYVIEAARREFLANPAFGATRQERLAALLGGGLRIETTLDPGLQALAHGAVGRGVGQLGGPTAALAATQPGTGRILAMVGGGSFAHSQFDLATQARRQPGSAFKTFALIAALEAGVDPQDSFEGDGPDEHVLPDGQVWTVSNFGGSRYGRVDLHEAFVRSINTAFAELTIGIGHERVIDAAKRLGIDEQAFGPPSTHGPAVALGGLTHGVSPLEMAAAYAALAVDGRYAEPYLLERVVAPDGTVIFERDPHAEQVLDPAVAGTTHRLLQAVVDSGTGQAARIPGWPVAGKTGTTQDSADAWFVGAVPPLAAAVWVGHPDQRVPMGGLTGGSVSAGVWHEFVTSVLPATTP
jgi:membrane peptidoglycan carboxypeptidase